MDLEKLAKYYFNVSNIPITFCGTNGYIAEFARKKFQPNMLHVFLKPILEKNSRRGVDLTVTVESLICGYVRDETSGALLLLGPVPEFPCLKENAYVITKAIGEKRNRADEVMDFFDQIPIMPLTTFAKHLLFLNYVVNGEEIQENMLEYQLEYLLGKERSAGEWDERVLHNTREMDRQLEACVEYGQLEELKACMQVIDREGKMGMAGGNSLRSFKNVAISSVALIARAAIRGGLNYEKALTMSDWYAREIEIQSSVEDAKNILEKAFFDYTSRVAKIRRLNSESADVRKISDYIQTHLYEQISVGTIAEYVGRNESSLCRSFKKTTGKTLLSYINECKMEEAKRRLAYTSDLIVDIAIGLGYSSQSYFTSVFGKYAGMSPAEYRKKTGG